MKKPAEKSANGARRIRYLGDLKRLDLKPGDQFVLMCSEKLTVAQMKALKAAWRKQMGNDFKVVVLGWGMKLGVINHQRKRAAKAPG